MTSIAHGITVTEAVDGAPLITTIATAVIGMICTGPAADAAAFPLDVPVLISDMAGAIGKAGETGTLKGCLQAIADQVSTPVVVVRVGVEADPEDQDALVVGGSNAGVLTGMQALIGAEANLLVKPRILVAPGLDSAAVTTALVVLAQKLRGFVYAKAIGADQAAAKVYAATYGARELMLIYDDFKIANIVSFATARAAGLRARIDQEQGWHKSLSNVIVDGVSGIAHPVHFDIMDATSEAGLLNDAKVTCLVNREGFRFWGNRTTAAADSVYKFEVYTRTAQVVIDTIAAGVTWAIDKPLTPGLVKDLVEQINGKLRELTRLGFLLGGKCWFDKTKNPDANLQGGQLKIDYDFGPVPPLEALGMTQHFTGIYEADFPSVTA